jgi:hypothetical protein
VPTIEFQAIRIDTSSHDEEGRLILVDGRLVGVLVRLDATEQAPLQGCWSLEAGFGPLASLTPEPFTDLDHARAWTNRIARPGVTPPASRDPVPG